MDDFDTLPNSEEREPKHKRTIEAPEKLFGHIATAIIVLLGVSFIAFLIVLIVKLLAWVWSW